MTPVIIGLANEDGVIMVKQLPPEPDVHWLWKWLFFGVPGASWLTCLVGVWRSG